MTSKLPDFDFELWAKLAKDSPEEFEKMRSNSIQEIIDNSSDEHKHRLEGLQWKIDQISEMSATPLSACLKISKLMWEHVTEEGGLQDQISTLTEPGTMTSNVPEGNAEIVQFPDRNKKD